MGLHLVEFECQSEFVDLINNTINLTGSLIRQILYSLCINTILDRANFSSYVAMKKSGTTYVNSDGNPVNPAVQKATGSNGDCVVYKNGSLITAACDQPAFFICENKLRCCIVFKPVLKFKILISLYSTDHNLWSQISLDQYTSATSLSMIQRFTLTSNSILQILKTYLIF